MCKKTSKQIFFAFCLLGTILLGSCNSDNDEPTKGPVQEEEQQEGSTQIETGGIKFDLSEQPFGADTEEGSRTPEPMTTTDTVQLCEDVSAEVTLEREHIPATRGTKRKLQNGTYQLYANQGTSWHVMTFKIQNNQMTLIGPNLKLNPGTYHFYCCNEKMVFNEADGKFTVGISNAGSELFGVAKNISISGADANVTMSLTRLSARVKVKLAAMMDFPSGVSTYLTSDQHIANVLAYDIATNNYYDASTGVLPQSYNTYIAAPDLVPATVAEQKYGTMKSIISRQYNYVFMGTNPSKLYVKFNGSEKLYGRNFKDFGLVAFQVNIPHLFANGSYVLRMRLVPNYRYLFHDGTIGYLRNKGTRIPIALRINDYIGIALSDAAPKEEPYDYTPHPDGMTIPAPGDEANWFITSWSNHRLQSRAIGWYDQTLPGNAAAPLYTEIQWKEPLANVGKGWYYTWDPLYTGTFYDLQFYPNMKRKGASKDPFPAFNWTDLHRDAVRNYCITKGKTDFSQALFDQQGKWYLPCVSEWKVFLLGIGLCNNFNQDNSREHYFEKQELPYAPYKIYHLRSLASAFYQANIINYALTVAGGSPLWDNNGVGYHYYTSDEASGPTRYGSTYAYSFTCDANNRVFLNITRKWIPFTYRNRVRVRAFVAL